MTFLKLCIFLCVLQFFTLISFAHDNLAPIDWIKEYKGKTGSSCCGHVDCRTAKIRMLQQQGNLATFEISTTEGKFVVDNFPLKGYHSSEDEQDWYCWTVAGMLDEFASYVKDEYPCNLTPTEQCINCIFISVKF